MIYRQLLISAIRRDSKMPIATLKSPVPILLPEGTQLTNRRANWSKPVNICALRLFPIETPSIRCFESDFSYKFKEIVSALVLHAFESLQVSHFLSYRLESIWLRPYTLLTLYMGKHLETPYLLTQFKDSRVYFAPYQLQLWWLV